MQYSSLSNHDFTVESMKMYKHAQLPDKSIKQRKLCERIGNKTPFRVQ